MYVDEYRSYFAFFAEESQEVLKVVNFQPVLRFSYQEYLSDGRKYLREIRKEYPEFRGKLAEEMAEEYFATEYADRMWQRDCEVFGAECRKLIQQCNHEFLAMPKREREKKIQRIQLLFSRYEEAWKYMFADYAELKEDFNFFLSYQG